MTGRGAWFAFRILGLVAVLLIAVFLLTSPEVASKRGGPVPCPQIFGPAINGPLGKTSPWVMASPCPGNSLSFGPSNILTIDHTFKGRDQTYPIRLWQNVGTDDYEVTWRSEDVSRYTDALIGDPDGDGKREIVALAWCDVQVGPKKNKEVERRVWLEGYELGSTGFPDFQGPDYFVIDSGYSRQVILANVDGSTPNDELVVLTSHRLALFTYDPDDGFLLLPGSVSSPVTPFMYHMDVGDVDGDSQLEVVVGTSDADIYVWEWQETGWTYTVSEPTGLPYISKVGVGNVDGDAGVEIVGIADDYDTRESYILVWRYDPGQQTYALISNWSDNLAGDAIIYTFDLVNLDADVYQELVFGTVGDLTNGRHGVLDFTGTEWTTLWSVTISAVTDYVAAGDVDGNPGTIELIFAGTTGDGLYLEVYAWTQGAASPSWSSIGEYGQAQALNLG